MSSPPVKPLGSHAMTLHIGRLMREVSCAAGSYRTILGARRAVSASKKIGLVAILTHFMRH